MVDAVGNGPGSDKKCVLTQFGAAKLEAALEEYFGESPSHQKIQDTFDINRGTVSKIRSWNCRKPVVRTSLERLFSGLEIDLLEDQDYEKVLLPTAKKKKKQHNETSNPSIRSVNWSEICHCLLLQQQKHRLSSQRLSPDKKLVDEVYLPVGLRRTMRQPRKSSNSIGATSSSVEAQEPDLLAGAAGQTESIPISGAEFFHEMTSQQERGRKVALLGETGSGKTTLLQKIALSTPYASIWIQASELDAGQSLEDFLTHKWLKRALLYIRKQTPELVPSLLEPTESLRNSFVEVIFSGKFCLFFDGLDELNRNFGDPLLWLTSELQSTTWLTDICIVLTCRLNVWNQNFDQLQEFETFSNLDFDSEQVLQFVDAWFRGQKSGKNLQDKIRQANSRIQSLLRNPLRLSLLCKVWNDSGDKLPETRTGLYQRLVNGYFEWQISKRTEHYTDKIRSSLIERLAYLAYKAFLEEESRFRLREKFVARILGEPEEKNSFFWWALELGLLMPVGFPSIEEIDADEPVYAFFHPSFQEYFVACYFSRSEDFSALRSHLFEPRWREVFLFLVEEEPDKLVIGLNEELNSFVDISVGLKETLVELDAKTRSVESSYTNSATRMFYFEISREISILLHGEHSHSSLCQGFDLFLSTRLDPHLGDAVWRDLLRDDAISDYSVTVGNLEQEPCWRFGDEENPRFLGIEAEIQAAERKCTRCIKDIDSSEYDLEYEMHYDYLMLDNIYMLVRTQLFPVRGSVIISFSNSLFPLGYGPATPLIALPKSYKESLALLWDKILDSEFRQESFGRLSYIEPRNSSDREIILELINTFVQYRSIPSICLDAWPEDFQKYLYGADLLCGLLEASSNTTEEFSKMIKDNFLLPYSKCA